MRRESRPSPAGAARLRPPGIIQRQNPAAVIALGDLQYETGAWADFKASYDKSWGKFKAKTKPALGNHEYRTPGAKGYYTYFGRKRQGYYTTSIGSWRLYVLNTNCNGIDCDKERRWLYAPHGGQPDQVQCHRHAPPPLLLR